MAKDCGMVEVSGVEDDEVELSLGLSIGGGFRKSEKSKPKRIHQQKLVDYCEIDADLKESDNSICRSSVSPAGEANETKENEVEFTYPMRKREIHALRRQEARKKREEKQHKKGACKGKNGGYLKGCIPIRNDSMDDKWFMAQVQTRVRDREAKEIEANQSEQIHKKDRAENGGSGSSSSCDVEDEQQNENLSLKQNQTLNQNPSLNPSAIASPPVPFVPMQYTFAPIKCIPFANGFTYPYVMPCWAPSSAAVDDDKNVFQPVACRAFRPFQAAHRYSNENIPMSGDSEQNGSKQAQPLLASTSGSRGSSSSILSDHQSGSQQGGSSSDTRSHSSHSPSEQHQVHASVANDTQGQSKHSASSQLLESTKSVEEATKTVDKMALSSITQSSPRKPEEKPLSVTKPNPINKPISTAENPPPRPLKEARQDRSKPPKPQTQYSQTPVLPRMPCVSTTGNGPNGKTITGFLYKYTKSEVSIICVCHGTSFSPAEFVKHAGGTDISNPLKHIIVVPSAFG